MKVGNVVPVIHANGSCELKTKPDIAHMRFGVTTKAETTADAMQQNAIATNALILALEKEGISKKDIVTGNVITQDIFEDEEEAVGKKSKKERKVLQQAHNEVSITVRDISKVGEIADLVAKLGKYHKRGTWHETSKRDELYKLALGRAVEDGIEKGRVMAQAAGISVKGISDVVEFGGEHVIQPQAMTMRAFSLGGAPESSTTVLPGELTIPAHVTVELLVESSSKKR